MNFKRKSDGKWRHARKPSSDWSFILVEKGNSDRARHSTAQRVQNAVQELEEWKEETDSLEPNDDIDTSQGPVGKRNGKKPKLTREQRAVKREERKAREAHWTAWFAEHIRLRNRG